jgi:hypothetical protein
MNSVIVTTVASNVSVTPNVLVTATVGIQGPPGAGMPETVVNLGTVSGTQALDLSLGTIFIARATGNCAWSFINPQPFTTGATLVLTNGGLVGQTFPGVFFPGKYTPALTPVGTDVLEFFSEDGWQTITGGVAVRDRG